MQAGEQFTITRYGVPVARLIAAQVGTLPIDVDRHQVACGELLALALRYGSSSYHAACGVGWVPPESVGADI